MYSFTPKTEDEVQAEQLAPDGLTAFTVLESSEEISKSEKNKGKPMIKLKLNVHADDGFDYHVYDYIADWFMAHKFRHFFFAIGQGRQYEAGKIDASKNAFAGKTGWADIGVQKAKGDFPAKNIIRDYKPQGEDSKASTVAKDKPAPALNGCDPDDDVPF